MNVNDGPVYQHREKQKGDKMVAEKEMPRYKCHKEVHALKIEKIAFEVDQETGNGARIEPSDPRFASFLVDREYLEKHNPQPGGYYVVYEGGYKSYSPAGPFDAGYTRI